ncbi:MAG TPA: alpha-amylase family glycosyl hydrolase [Armatimonadota bacterium]|nr:alpha-amylase family glycosyl hydrolase [Armatimonadota bacterium]
MGDSDLHSVTLTSRDDEISLQNGRIELRFCRKTGRWTALFDSTSDKPLMTAGELLSSVTITVNGRTTVTTGREHLWSLVDTETIGTKAVLTHFELVETQGESQLVLTKTEGDWTIQERYALGADSDTVQRSVMVRWQGEQEALVRWLELRTPIVTQLSDALLEAPGYPGVLHQPLDRLPMGIWRFTPDIPDADAPVWRPGLLAIHRDQSNILLWGFNDEIPSLMLARRGDAGVWFTQKMYACCRLQPGQSLEVGTQFLRMRHGEFTDAISDFQDFWDSVDIVAAPRPDWAQDARIYELHVGEKQFHEQRTAMPYPTIDDVIADLPRIAQLGFNIIELMPHMPYPSYSVHDYYDIATHYAPKDDMVRFVTRAHELGLKVLLDVIMHGVTDKSVTPASPIESHPYLVNHPEWFSRTEDGRIARTYTKAFDHANPGFQQFIIDVFCFYLRELDVDGFRVDALTWNFFPNWAKDLPYPGYKSFYASEPLFRRIRAALHAMKPEILLYTETTGPLFSRCYDLSYNYDEQWIYGLLPLKSTRGYANNGLVPSRDLTAREVAEWFHVRRLVLPRGWRRVHHLDSHDSHEWGGKAMFRREAFGIPAARMLFAMCAFLDGGVMNYARGEDESEEHYRHVLALRESIPSLRDGTCDYLAIHPSDDRVFTPLRRLGDSWALPVFSFATEAITVNIPLAPLALTDSATYTLREEFSGQTITATGSELAQLNLELPAYAVQLWRPITQTNS